MYKLEIPNQCLLDGLRAEKTCNRNFQLPWTKKTRIDVYELLCPQQMLVHKGGKIKNCGGECRDVTPTNCTLKIYLKRALGGSRWM